MIQSLNFNVRFAGSKAKQVLRKSSLDIFQSVASNEGEVFDQYAPTVVNEFWQDKSD